MLDKKTVDLKDKIFKAMMTNKRELVRRYGKDAEKVAMGKSISQAKKQIEANADDNIDESFSIKLKEAVKQCLSEKIDKNGDEWEDPEEYNKDLTDYEPSQKEIDDFKRDEQGLPPKQQYQPQVKPEYTGWAYLEVSAGLGKWSTVKYGPNKIIYGQYTKLIKEDPNNSNRYRVVPERKR